MGAPQPSRHDATPTRQVPLPVVAISTSLLTMFLMRAVPALAHGTYETISTLDLHKQMEVFDMSQIAFAEHIDFFRLDANRRLNPANRSALGQFMTPAPIASFMASLFENLSGPDISLLDPGAGVCSLTAAFVEECLNRAPLPHSISATAYEIEPVLLDYLHSTLNHCCQLARNSKITFTEKVKPLNFIEDGTALLTHDLLQGPSSEPLYTHVIMNPPYKKIHSESTHRRALSSVGIETSNLYTVFQLLFVSSSRMANWLPLFRDRFATGLILGRSGSCCFRR